jgi:hypothetical protein
MSNKKLTIYGALLAGLLIIVVPASVYGQALGMEDDQLPADFTTKVNPRTMHGPSQGAGGVLGNRSNGSILGIDSLVNWSSYFYFPGLDSNGFPQFTWQYTMVGHSPFIRHDRDRDRDDDDWRGETTTIDSPVVPVIVDLRNFDGSPRFVGGHRLISDGSQFVAPTLRSPIFSKTFYSSSESATQFTDAVQRAEFFHKADDDWHTLLRPRVRQARTMVLIRGTYRFVLNPDGSCCAFILVDFGTFINALFPATPADTTTPIGAAEHTGDIRTRDLSSFLFPNTFLFFGDPNNCCVIGFHTYDLEPGGPDNGFRERRYVLNYSSWVTPGLFGSSFADITALSHELSETFNDPFVNNTVPWWLSPNGNCQNNLEDGDVIEGLPNAEFPITLNGSTWHPQNEALVQWFAGETPSSAINHAYSYPDITVLTSASTSQNVGCAP